MLFLRVQMRSTVFAILSLLLFAGCSDYGKIYKSKNNSLKYEKAVQLYLKKDYARALPLFEQLRDAYGRITDSLEQVYYYTAYCNYGLGDYETASLIFKDYTESFTRSKRHTECAYMAVYCDFKSVRSFELDQSHTVKTIGALQSFINYYPNTEYALRCNDHIDELRKKLILKEYSYVIQHYRMGNYRATVVSAKNTLKLYTDVSQKEELEYLIVKAQFLYAENSIEKKRAERYKEVVEFANDYIYSNGQSGLHSKEVLELSEKAKSALKKITTPI